MALLYRSWLSVLPYALLVSIFCLFFSIVFFFHVKTEHSALVLSIRKLYVEMDDVKNDLHILRTEWSYMNHPNRLKFIIESNAHPELQCIMINPKVVLHGIK